MTSLFAGFLLFLAIAIYAAAITGQDAKADRGLKPVFSFAKLKEVVSAPAEKSA